MAAEFPPHLSDQLPRRRRRPGLSLPTPPPHDLMYYVQLELAALGLLDPTPPRHEVSTNPIPFTLKPSSTSEFMDAAAAEQGRRVVPPPVYGHLRRPVGTGAYLPCPSEFRRFDQWTPDSDQMNEFRGVVPHRLPPAYHGGSGTGVFLPRLASEKKHGGVVILKHEQQTQSTAKRTEEETVVEPKSPVSELGLPDEWPY